MLDGNKYDLNDIEDLIKLIGLLECKSIAFIPQNNPKKNWIELLEELSKVKELTDIYFYHINKDDFNQLYNSLK